MDAEGFTTPTSMDSAAATFAISQSTVQPSKLRSLATADPIDKQTSVATEIVINVGILPIVFVIGVVSNLLNMLVFTRLGLRDRINVILFSLAVADCGYLLAVFSYKMFSLLWLLSPDLGDYWRIRSLNTVIGVFWGFSSTSNLLTLVVAMERCLCVASPLHAKQWLSTRRTVIVVVIVYVVILSSSMIFNVKFDVGTKRDPLSNATVYSAVLSSFYIQNKVWVDVIYNYILAIVIPTLSLLGVAISTVVTVFCLRRAVTWKEGVAKAVISVANGSQNRTGASERRETAVTQMLLAVCYVYITCITPSVANAFAVQFVDGWLPTGKYSNTFYLYVAIMHLLSAVNASFNFFIYFSRGSRFRACFWDLVDCRRCFRLRGGKGRHMHRAGTGSAERGTRRSTMSVISSATVQSLVLSATDPPDEAAQF